MGELPIIKILTMNNTLDTYKFLEENGVFIHYIPEHYKDGGNFPNQLSLNPKELTALFVP